MTLPPPKEALTRLEKEKNIWIATVRRDGRPHLVPIWFIFHENMLYICIQKESVKARNIKTVKSVALALENGSTPVICEGLVKELLPPWPEKLVKAFKQKYDWDIATDKDYDQVLRISPIKWMTW